MSEINRRLDKALEWCKERELECKRDPTKRDSWNTRKARRWNREYQRKRRRYDERFKLNAIMSSRIRHSLKGAAKSGRHWEDLVGYSLEKLERHLKRTIPDGYIWQDFLEGKLHIDHKIPIAAFNFSSAEHLDFRECWSLKNLRLLPKTENLKKGSKLKKPFQAHLRV